MVDEARNRAAGQASPEKEGFVSKAPPLGEDFVLKMFKE